MIAYITLEGYHPPEGLSNALLVRYPRLGIQVVYEAADMPGEGSNAPRLPFLSD
jgi:hypothetical protein